MSPRSVAASRITSADNAQVKRIARLLESARERRIAARFVIEGPHLIEAFARSNAVFDLLAISESGQENTELRRLFEVVQSQTRLVLTDRVFAKLSDLASPAGILAVSGPPGRTHEDVRGDVVFLDRVQDAGNVGAILRTAAAAGASELVCGPGTADVWSPRVLRAAMGAHCAIATTEHDFAAVRRLRQDHQVIATGADGDLDLYRSDLTGPTLWLFGSEGAGLDPVLRQQATRFVRIPIAAGVESLNVAAAAAVCLFEQRRQRLDSARHDDAIS